MRLTVSHKTEYTYDQPVDYSLQQVRLTPRTSAVQEVLNWELDIDGGRIETSYTDHNGTIVHLVSATPDTRALSITASGQVETTDTAGVLGMVYGPAPLWYFLKQSKQTTAGDGIAALAHGLASASDRLSALHALAATILLAVPYQTGETYAETTAEEALTGGRGVCQDHAQIFVAAARAAGIPARYVSGYLMIEGRDAQDAGHAWAEAHVDGLGWVGFDVSNGISPDERYIRLGSGLDYRDAAPVSGLRLGSARESMIVSLQVQQ